MGVKNKLILVNKELYLMILIMLDYKYMRSVLLCNDQRQDAFGRLC